MTLKIYKNYILFLFLGIIFNFQHLFAQASKPKVCITLDDINYLERPLYSGLKRDSIIRAVLRAKKVKAGLFFIGSYLEGPKGQSMLKEWDKEGHYIMNHTYSHLHYDEEGVSFGQYSKDLIKCDSVLKGCKNYKKIFRFPFLEEGNTIEKRAAMREFLQNHQYKPGYVSIPTTDWKISYELEKALIENPSTDLSKFKKLYLENIKECALYYNEVASKVTGRQVNHLILLHHNLLSALFLGDLIDQFKAMGWEITTPEVAFKDPIYNQYPHIFPSTGSLFLTLAKQEKKTESISKRPVLPENQVFDKDYLSKFGL
ncbi:MAG TPA: polysaccharide deacetylase family protein [Cytophagaceae bacterium]|jgi:peptidoglycan/xylan/chitin deacetylase (PgdA/CDA1 family)